MIRTAVFLCVALGLALIALLLRASGNNAFFGEHFTLLFWIGLALTGGLTLLIAGQVHSLWRKLNAGVFGAKLALRLMIVFALMAVIPGGLVYTISVQFLNRSIDSWFDVPVERALQSALDLGKTALDSGLTDFAARVRDAAIAAAELRGDDQAVARQIRARGQFDEVTIFSESAEVLATALRPPNLTRFQPELPTRAEVSGAIKRAPRKSIETGEERTLYFRVLILIPSATEVATTRVLQVMQQIQKKIANDAASVENGFRDYQQLGAQRDGLKRLFALTLTLAMVLTLFSAILLSFLLSERLSAPLSALAESTRAIAKGDFSKLNPVKSRDEFGVLTQSFNTMTRQLSEASAVVAHKQHELENANTYLESILDNLTSGVLTLDERLQVKSINRNAEEMLGLDRTLLRGQTLPEWAAIRPALAPLTAEICTQIAASQTPSRDRPWERQIVIDLRDHADPNPALAANPMVTGTINPSRIGKRTLLVRGTKLPTGIESGYVLVFNDITGLIQAQRDAAWGEVARRLAHEIKNPLTPIQLSAERLQMKLADKLPPHERDLLARATHTIVAQVGALKGMVDDFSLYSRSSRLTLGPVDLNELIGEVLVLYESMHARVETSFDPTLPIISGDPALLRQVIHNLMQNALDATLGVADAAILLSTRIDGTFIELRVADNGSGIRDEVRERMFEPYVTTKPKGTGLGLAIVKKIIDEHGGRIRMDMDKDRVDGQRGACVIITLPTAPTETRATRPSVGEPT